MSREALKVAPLRRAAIDVLVVLIPAAGFLAIIAASGFRLDATILARLPTNYDAALVLVLGMFSTLSLGFVFWARRDTQERFLRIERKRSELHEAFKRADAEMEFALKRYEATKGEPLLPGYELRPPQLREQGIMPSVERAWYYTNPGSGIIQTRGFAELGRDDPARSTADDGE